MVIINMMTKSAEKIYKEPFLSDAGVSFNTNDSMICTGNSNGDVIIRNLLNPEGNPLDKQFNVDVPHESGISEVILSHFQSQTHSDRCAVTQAKFSIVKRHILASAYQNGHIVIWDTTDIFKKIQTKGVS